MDAESFARLAEAKEWVKSHFALYSFLRLGLKRLMDRFESAKLAKDIEGIGNIGGSAVIPLRLAAKGKASAGWDLCRQSLKGIAAIANDQNIPAMLVIFPFLSDLDNSYPFRAEHELIVRAGRENKMVVVDLLPDFMGLEPSSLWVTPTDSHPNARGHLIAAGAIYRVMLSHALVPSTASPETF